MKTNFEKIKEIIKDSNLSEREQEEFLIFLSFVSDIELEPIVKMIEKDKKWVVKAYMNVKSKYLAFVSKDKKLLDKILKEEEKIFENNDF